MMMTPTNEQELSECVAQAKGSLAIQGGGTRGVAVQGDVLNTTGISGIDLYEPGALTVVVKAGTAVQEIETALSAERQRLAFEPMDHRGLLGLTGTSTIGGVVAANISGPRRIQVGAARDFTMGVRFIDGQGAIVKNGGRVMKNVTGYDLVKLMSGSWGTLGVLSEVSLKVLPMPEAEATLQIHGLNMTDAVAAMAAALGSPNDVSGAAHLPDGDGGVTMIRVEGFEKSVAYRIAQLREALGKFGSEMSQAKDSAADWAAVRDVQNFHNKDGDVWRISVKPSDGPAVVAATDALEAQFDWAGGLVWLRTPAGADVRTKLAGIAGHATLVRGTGTQRFQPETNGVAALSAGLRQRFDPKGILNAGLMSA
jgi:glycolate oxidase FAD binding subunit